MTATRVLLTRHAESADPTVFHGAESDIALSEFGRRQAAAASEWFREFRPDILVSSAMRRAVETASRIARACEVPHVVEPGFHERIIGDLCGTRFSSTEGPWADTLHEWISGNTSYTTPGAESFDDLRARTLSAWSDTVRKFSGQRIVIVSHGVVCKVLPLCLLEDWGARRWHDLGRVENLATSEFVFDGGSWRAERLLFVPASVRNLRDDDSEPREISVA